MQRYTVTIVTPESFAERPVLLVPFQPSAIVTAFVDELYKRIARQGLSIAPNTHVATLHLDGETGAIIDYEDVLSDVVSDPKADKIFAVFEEKEGIAASVQSSNPSRAGTEHPDDVPVRVVTPSTAKNRDACPILRLPGSATIRQLHERVAEQLKVASKFDDNVGINECNCKLAQSLADGAAAHDSFLVVHGKSVVERLRLETPNEISLKTALRQRFGQGYEDTKKAILLGAELHSDDRTAYKKNPVVAVCSKKRHTPSPAFAGRRQTAQTLRCVMVILIEILVPCCRRGWLVYHLQDRLPHCETS